MPILVPQAMMRVAIYQLGQFHTEIFGFLLDALAHAGHDPVIYNNNAVDPCSFLRYYDRLFKRPLVVRPCDALLHEHTDYDRIIMATVDDFIWPELSHGESHRIIAIEHERGWWKPEIQCHVGLSPFVSVPHMFPIYVKPPTSTPSDDRHKVPSRSHRLHLAIVGDVTQAKHIEEVMAFLDHSPDTRVSFFARRATPLAHDIRTYAGPRVQLRDNLSAEDLVTVLESDDVDAIWTPIRQGVNHSTFKLTGALPLAFNLQKLLIVPDMIADAYELRGAVVYTSGVEGLREMLGGWDERSEEDWSELSLSAATFAQRTVLTNERLLRQMLETGVGAAQHPAH